MDNPYRLFRNLANMYRMYYETPFALRDDGLSSERRALLDTEGSVYREPFIESMPRFASSNKTVADACRELGLPDRVSQFLTSGLFSPTRRLWMHQWQAFSAAMRGRHVVVTS